MATIINKIEYYLPSKILDNIQLEKEFPEWYASKIEDKTGIRERHIIEDDQTALDMAYQSSIKVLDGFDKDLIDFVLLCTQSPDYFLPTSACLLQERLGLRNNIGALDFNLGACSGFVYGLAMAKGLINTGVAKNILLVTSETYSKHIHPKDKANRSIFGDGSASVIISESESEHIHNFDLGTDGKGECNLIVRNGALKNKIDNNSELYDDSNNVISDNHLYMNGPEIFNFTIENVPKLVNNVLNKNNLTIDTVDYVIFHQANKFMLDYLRKKIKIAPEKFYNNMLHTGNTVSATIPIAMKDCLDNKIIKKGDKILIVGFGVGYSWGGTVIEL